MVARIGGFLFTNNAVVRMTRGVRVSHLQQRGALEGFAALPTWVRLLTRMRPERERYLLKRTVG